MRHTSGAQFIKILESFSISPFAVMTVRSRNAFTFDPAIYSEVKPPWLCLAVTQTTSTSSVNVAVC